MRTELWLAASLVLPPSLFAAAPHFEAGRKEDHGPGGRVLVRCDAGETIGRTLSRLEKWRPHSLNVSGTCHENLSIAGFDDLTIVGKTGAALVPVPPATAPAIDVSASRLVSIEGLTIRAGDDPWRAALTLAACQDCRLRNVTVDGGVGFWAVSWSHVTLSRFTLTGTGAYGIGVFHAKVDMEDSVLDGGAGSRQCGLCLFENAVAVVFRSEFKGFLVGVSASSGGQVTFWDHSTATIELPNRFAPGLSPPQ